MEKTMSINAIYLIILFLNIITINNNCFINSRYNSHTNQYNNYNIEHIDDNDFTITNINMGIQTLDDSYTELTEEDKYLQQIKLPKNFRNSIKKKPYQMANNYVYSELSDFEVSPDISYYYNKNPTHHTQRLPDLNVNNNSNNSKKGKKGKDKMRNKIDDVLSHMSDKELNDLTKEIINQKQLRNNNGSNNNNGNNSNGNNNNNSNKNKAELKIENMLNKMNINNNNGSVSI